MVKNEHTADVAVTRQRVFGNAQGLGNSWVRIWVLPLTNCNIRLVLCLLWASVL